MGYESVRHEQIDRKALLRRPTYPDMKALGLAPATNFDNFDYARARDSVTLPGGMKILKSTGVLDSLGRPTYRLDEETLRYVKAAAEYQRRNRPDFDADVPAETAGDTYGSDRNFMRHERKKRHGIINSIRGLLLAAGMALGGANYAMAQQSNREYAKPSNAIVQSVSPEAAGLTATAYIYNDRGDQLPLNVEGFQGGPTSSFPIDLTNKKIYSIKLTGNGGLQTGWLKVVTGTGRVIPLAQLAVGGDPGQPRYETNLTAFVQDNDVSLTGNFTAYQNGLPPATVGVLPSEPMRASVVPVEMSGTSMTGKALANLKNVPNECLSILYDDGKSIVSETLFTLDPNGHVAQFIDQEFPNTRIPAKGMVQTVCEYPVAVLALQVQGAGMTSIPAMKGKGDYHSNVPILTAVDMFDNGTLQTKDPEKLPAVKNAQARYRNNTTGQETTINFNDEGYSRFRTAAGQPAKLAPGRYTRNVSAPRYFSVEQVITIPDTPEIVPLPDLTNFNPAFYIATAWEDPRFPKGTVFTPASERPWTFYEYAVDGGTLDLSQGTMDRLVHDLYKHVVTKLFPKTGFVAGGKPFGADDVVVTSNPPDVNTFYTYHVRRGPDNNAVLAGPLIDRNTCTVINYSVRWPRNVTINGIRAIGSDMVLGPFGREDNDIDVRKFGLSMIDTVLVENVGGNTVQTPYPTPGDSPYTEFERVVGPCSVVEQDKAKRPEKKYP